MSVFSSILWVTCSVNSDSHALVVRPGCEPVDVPTGQPALGTPPEPYVVPFGRAARSLLLVSEVLLAVEQTQRADWRLVVATPGEGRGENPRPAPHAEIISSGPSARVMAA